MMEDYDRTMELVETAQDSAGKSSEQFAKYQDTLEYKLNQLKNTWEQIRTTFINSNFFKDVVDMANNALGKIADIDLQKALPLVVMITPLIKRSIEIISKGFMDSANTLGKVGSIVGKTLGEKLNKTLKDTTKKLNDLKVKISFDQAAKKKLEKQIDEFKNKLKELQLEKRIQNNRKSNIEQELDKIREKGIELIISMSENEEKREQIQERMTELSEQETEEYKNLEKELEELTAEYENLERERDKVWNTENEVDRLLTDVNDSLTTLDIRTEQYEEHLSELEGSLGEVNERLEEQQVAADELNENEELLNESAKNASDALTLVGTTVAGVATALISGADAGDTFKTALLTISATAVGMVGKMVNLGIEGAVAAAVSGEAIGAAFAGGIETAFAASKVGLIILGIVAVIAAVGWAIAAAVKKWKKEHQTIEEQLEEAKKSLEETEKLEEEKKNDAREKKETYKNTENLIKQYDELSNKLVKTTEEQERWTKLIGEINEQFPDVVSQYDEATGTISVQRDLWQDILELQKESAIEAQEQAGMASAVAGGQRISVADLENKKVQKDTEDLKNSMVQHGLQYEMNYQFGQADMLNAFSGEYQDLIEKYFEIDFETATQEEIDEFLGRLSDESDEAWENFNDAIANIQSSAQESFERVTRVEKENRRRSAASNLSVRGASDSLSDFLTLGYKEKDASGELDSNVIKQMNFGEELDDAEKKKKIEEDDYWRISYENAYQLYHMTQETTDDLDSLNDSQRELIQNYLDNYSSLTGAERQNATAGIKESIGSLDNADHIMNDLVAKNEQINEQVQEIAQQIKNVDETFDGSDWSIDQLTAFAAKVQEAVNELGEGGATSYIEGLNDLFNGLDPSKINQALNEINWDTANAINWDEFRETSIEKLKELGIPGAEAFFDKWAEYEQKFGHLSISLLDEDKVEEYLEGIKEKIDAINGSRGDIAELSAKVNQGVALDFDEYQKYAKAIEEMGLAVEDYLNIDADGNILANVEKIQTLWQDGYQQQINDIQTQIDNIDEEYQLQLDQLNVVHDQNLAYIQGLKIIKQQTKSIKEQELAQMKSQASYNRSIGNIAAANEIEKQIDRREKELQSSVTDSEYKNLLNEENERDRIARETLKQGRTEAEKALREELVRLKKEYNAALKAYEKDNSEANKKILEEQQKLLDDLEKANEDYAKTVEENQEKVADAWEKVADAQEKVQDALDKIAEKEQDVIDKTNELNKILYGDGTYRSSLDPMYNYNNQAEILKERQSDLKDLIENAQAGDDYQGYMNGILDVMHQKAINRDSKMVLTKTALNNTMNAIQNSLPQKIAELNAKNGTNMQGNFSDFISDNGDVFGVNFDYQDMATNSDFKDLFTSYVQELNDLRKTIRELEKEGKEDQKEMLKMREDAIEKRISAEEKLAKYLEDEAKKELETQKEKFDAIKEANDDYLSALEDAINKEKELRDRQNEWDTLATKEKKLSLMQRDTSGANQKEVLKLEEEVQTERDKLLDNSIQDIIDSMKELYDLQQETREMELEYQEKLIESAQYMKIAEEMINGFENEEDAIETFLKVCLGDFGDSITSFNQLTESQQEKILNTVNQTTGDIFMSSEVMNSKIGGSAQDAANNIENISRATTEEVSQNIINNSENLTTKAEYDLNQVVTSVDDAIDQGKQAIVDAVKEVQDARDNYLQALADLEEAQKAARQAEEDARKAEQEANDARQQALADAAEYEAQKQKYDNFDSDGNRINVDALTEDQLNANIYAAMGMAGGTEFLNTNPSSDDKRRILRGYPHYYESGGLVNYTGPAWVDGTPSKPEAFLSAEDTQRIGLAAQLLSKIPLLNSNDFNNVSTSITNSSVTNEGSLIEVHINVESISNDLDLDNALDKMKNAIWDAARPAGSAVILTK